MNIIQCKYYYDYDKVLLSELVRVHEQEKICFEIHDSKLVNMYIEK